MRLLFWTPSVPPHPSCESVVAGYAQRRGDKSAWFVWASRGDEFYFTVQRLTLDKAPRTPINTLWLEVVFVSGAKVTFFLSDFGFDSEMRHDLIGFEEVKHDDGDDDDEDDDDDDGTASASTSALMMPA